MSDGIHSNQEGGSQFIESCLESYVKQSFDVFHAMLDNFASASLYQFGAFKYCNEFMSQFLNALKAFHSVEVKSFFEHSIQQNLADYSALMNMGTELTQKGFSNTFDIISRYHLDRVKNDFLALSEMNFSMDTHRRLSKQQRKLLERVIVKYPKAIENIKKEFGFHFDQIGYIKTAETERFELYQILPTDRKVTVRENGKPVLIIPPYVLGPNILAFLPGSEKSYAHSHANNGIPTYIRIVKNIQTEEAVQTMSGEDDVLDTQYFCRVLNEKHGRKATLNGYCQGGFLAVLSCLTGKLDAYVDALVTCVAPLDGTRSLGFKDFMEKVPARFNGLEYSTRILTNGNEVIDGEIMSFVYKLKSIEYQSPLYNFYKDLILNDIPGDEDLPFNKTALALNEWLLHDKADLPKSVIQMSFDSYTRPVTREGVLPVRLFGKDLNFKHIDEKKIRFLICYADKDDLVDKEAALAPLDYIKPMVTVFPKGHAAIATSWSHPLSDCALHKRFGDKKQYVGPVRFHLDMEEGF